jgi:phospholipid/cholesterol/gamma-HCH transport system substrate-binding protein
VSAAIRKHLRDALSIVALAVLGIAVAVAILSQQRATFPAWLPVLGEERFELRVQLSSAQAVVAGQGQSVTLAGVEVGEVSGVEVEDGRAVVTVGVKPRYAPLIHSDATVLLRPRTGLMDMTLDVDPGREGPAIAEGATVPLSQTLPNVQPDEILRMLDADTRAYLKALLQGGAQGLGGRGVELSAGLRRLEPTARDIARIAGAVAKRRANLRRAVHSFRLLSEELARRDTELGEFVDSSAAALGGFAAREAEVRAALRELPGTLRATGAALTSAQGFARTARPALRRLVEPSAALGPALRALQPFATRTLAPIRDQVRPFTREVRAPVRHLAELAGPLGDATPALARGTRDLNAVLNTLAYNPPGPEEGFLFWAGWLNHTGNALFATQDANGPLRRGMVLLSCQTAGLAEGVAAGRPFLKTLQEATRIPTSEQVCPLDPFTF